MYGKEWIAYLEKPMSLEIPKRLVPRQVTGEYYEPPSWLGCGKDPKKIEYKSFEREDGRFKQLCDHADAMAEFFGWPSLVFNWTMYALPNDPEQRSLQEEFDFQKTHEREYV